MSTLHSKTGVRKKHREFKSTFEPVVEICFMLQDWDDAYNVGGLFRVADGCGATELVMTGKTPVPPDNPMIPVTSLGQHRRIPFRHFQNHEEACTALKAEGWTLVALEIAEGAENYLDFEFPERTCLVLGNEGAGVYGKVMRHVQHSVYIPMMGKGRSLNVTVSAAVVAYQAVLRGRGSEP